jgi:2-amino-4-hydroxy-6-hydroxymethyldihydropteridine diphosphokinase
MPRVLLAFGSNIEPARNVPASLQLLKERVRVLAVSPVYETPPEGAEGSAPFLNGAVEIETELTEEELRQQVLHTIEKEMGRVRTSDPNAPRTIDLDILQFGDGPLVEDARTYAHVAIPLADVCPDDDGLKKNAARFAEKRATFRIRSDVAV